jgi:small-conductance mechanosensitive channel
MEEAPIQILHYYQYLILIVLSIGIAWIASKFLRKTIDFFIKRSSDQLQADPTNFIFLKNSVSFVCYSIALFWIFTKIPYFQHLGKALFASAGIFAAIVGFASQKAFSNIVGGIFLLIFRPFRVGDSVQLQSGQRGLIEEITLRHTIIKDVESRRIVIPNSIMSEDTIINSSITDKRIRKQIDIGIAYDANLEQAEGIIKNAILNHPLFMDNRTSEEIEEGIEAVPVKLIAFGESSINLRTFAWVSDHINAHNLHCDILRTIKIEFDKAGVEIPFPYRTVIFKNPPVIQEVKNIDSNAK